MELSYYSVSNEVSEETDFACLVLCVIKKRSMVILKVKSRYHKHTHKYGVDMPRSLAHNHKMDWYNGNTLWMEAYDK